MLVCALDPIICMADVPESADTHYVVTSSEKGYHFIYTEQNSSYLLILFYICYFYYIT